MILISCERSPLKSHGARIKALPIRRLSDATCGAVIHNLNANVHLT